MDILYFFLSLQPDISIFVHTFFLTFFLSNWKFLFLVIFLFPLIFFPKQNFFSTSMSLSWTSSCWLCFFHVKFHLHFDIPSFFFISFFQLCCHMFLDLVNICFNILNLGFIRKFSGFSSFPSSSLTKDFCSFSWYLYLLSLCSNTFIHVWNLPLHFPF